MKIFISSVIRGLEDERKAATEAISSLGHTPRRAEDYAASPESPQIVCRAGVREADAVVLLLGERYGDLQASGKSATHEEYEEAQLTQRPVLAFVKTDMSPDPHQRAFIEEVRAWVGGEFHGRVTGLEDVRSEVVRAIHEFDLARAVGPADPAEMQGRAVAAVPARNPFGGATPRLVLVIAAGPRQQVLRPRELEDREFARSIQKEAMFGPWAVLDPDAATKVAPSGGQLRFIQPDSEVVLAEDGTTMISQPAYSGADGFGLRAIVHEAVEERLSTAVGFASEVLQRIDPIRRLSDVVPLVALLGAGHGAWRTRAEQQANPTSMQMNMNGSDRLIVPGEPMRLNRPALLATRKALAEDLAVLLRRAAVERP